MFRDNICLEYVMSKQKFLSPYLGPLEIWPKGNVDGDFHFVSHQGLLRSKGLENHSHNIQGMIQVDVLVKEMYTPKPFFFPNPPFTPNDKITASRKITPLKKLFVLAVLLEKSSFPGKLTFLVREKIKINVAQAKMTFESKQKFAFCFFFFPFLLIIHWCAKENSPNIASHKPFGAVHRYSLS